MTLKDIYASCDNLDGCSKFYEKNQHVLLHSETFEEFLKPST